MAMMFFPFVLKKPQLWMYGLSSSSVSAANCSGVLYFAYSTRVHLFTCRSVHCAASMVETSSSNGERYSSAGFASGYASASSLSARS